MNVTAYGATGNGITDDTAAITSAVAALVDGSELYFPAGTYLISASAPIGNIFVISKTGIKVFGDGIGESIIKIADGCSPYQAIFHNGGHDVTGLEVCDLTFDHNIANNPIGPNLLAGTLVDEGTWNGGTTYHENDIVLQPDTWSYYKCILQHTNHEPPSVPPSVIYWTPAPSEIIAYPEISVAIGLGSTDLSMHNLEFINSSSMWHIFLETNGTGIVIENITCSNVGDDPNHIFHDTSIIYTEASHVLIQNCDFTAASKEAPAAITAIETHGSDTLVQNCTITDFRNGMNITGIARAGTSSGIRVTGNHFVNLCGGIWVWSMPLSGYTSTDYGIDGLQIDHNDIDLTADDANERFGIEFYWGNTLDINDVNIHDNTISMSAIESVASDVKWYDLAIGIITPAASQKNSNFTIADNTITNFPSNAIRFQDCDIQNVSVTGNTFIDCASALPATGEIVDSPILVHDCVVDTLTFAGNAFIDDVPVTRIRNWFYLLYQVSCTGLTISGNTYSMTGDGVAFVRPIRINEDISQPLITETIADFVPPTHKVDPASTVTDGTATLIGGIATWSIHGTTWTVDATGLTWTSTEEVVDWNDVIDLPQITVTGLSTGNAVRLYDSAGNLHASAVESGGTATLTYTLD